MSRAWLVLIVGHLLVFAVAIGAGIARAGGPDAGEVEGERSFVSFCVRTLNPDGGEPLPLPEACFRDPRIGGLWGRR